MFTVICARAPHDSTARAVQFKWALGANAPDPPVTLLRIAEIGLAILFQSSLFPDRRRQQ